MIKKRTSLNIEISTSLDDKNKNDNVNSKDKNILSYSSIEMYSSY